MEFNTEQIAENNVYLMCIQSRPLQKRINRELQIMYKLYIYVSLYVHLNDIIITIFEKINDKMQHYKFYIQRDFPFVPPKIYLNGRHYIDFLQAKTPLEQSLTKYVSSFDCLCCESLNCKNNWNISYTINDIIVEIRRFKIHKRNIVNKLLADKIKKRCLITDINLDEWLF